MEKIWSQRNREGMKSEKMETVKRWGTSSGPVDVFCLQCRRPWGLNHVCQGLRLKPLSDGSREALGMNREEIAPPASSCKVTRDKKGVR